MTGKKRFTDKEKRSDPWYRRLSRDERDIYEYFLDICDHGGFFEIDMEYGPEDIAEELKLSGWEGVAKEFARTCQVLTKGLARGSKVVIKGSLTGKEKIYGWIPHYIKFQHISKADGLNTKIAFHRHVINLLLEKKKQFPEVKIYLDFLSNAPLRGCQGVDNPLVSPNGNGNGNGNNKIERECEREEDDLSIKETNPLYVDWVKKYPQMRAVLSYERFIELVHRWPEKDVDYSLALEWLYECELNSNDDKPINGYLMLTKAFSNTGKGKGFRKAGVEAQVDPVKAEYEKEKNRLNMEYAAGRIDEDECRKLQAENQAKYDGGGE